MPERALSPCKKPGCPNLVRGRGYCPDHQQKIDARKRFDYLNARKTPEQKRFYSSRAWTYASKSHRAKEPLCERCKERGIVKAAELVHHDPPLNVLWARKLNPYSDKYLVSLCNRCHLDDLRAKRGRAFN